MISKLFILLLAFGSSKSKSDNQWKGAWERTYWQNTAVLTIDNVSNDTLNFSLFAFNGANSGEIEGSARINGNTATYLNVDIDTCLIQFTLQGDSIILVEQKTFYCEAGLGVTYSGEYKNERLLPMEAPKVTLNDLKILETREQDSVFQSLVGEKYPLFVSATHMVSKTDDLDFNVTQSGIRGLFTIMEYIIMIDKSNTICAAIIDDQKILYFTNSKKFKKKLPLAIENWRERFQEYEVVFK